MTSEGGRSAYSESSAEYQELFPLPPSSAQAVSKNLSSLDAAATKKKPPTQPIMDTNYSYDFQCEVAHNPFLSPNTPGPMPAPRGDGTIGHVSLSSDHQPSLSVDTRSDITAPSPATPATTTTASVNVTPDQSHALGSVATPVSEPVLGTVAPPPTLHPAIDYTQAQAHPAPATASGWNGRANGIKAQTTEDDETEALVAALKASTAEQGHHDDSHHDHDFDLFGVGKP